VDVEAAETARREPGRAEHRLPLGDPVVAHVRGVAQHFERVEEGVARGILGRDRVAEQEEPAGNEHARHLAHHRLRVGDVMRREPRGHDVEARVRKRQLRGVAELEAHVVEAALGGGLARLREHRGCEVERDHRRDARGKRERGGARATADVEHALAPGRDAGGEHRLEVGPAAVDRAHCVARGRRAEPVLDRLGLVHREPSSLTPGGACRRLIFNLD
jgi:hypothetical protein